MSPFKQLGLAEGATPDEVKGAWRKLASALHPDRGGDASEFTRMRRAYESALAEAEAPKVCTKCGGEGRILHANGWSSINVNCDRCGGSGVEP